MSWRVQKIWSGRTVAVCASGQSMNASIAGELRRRGVPTIVVNRTFELAPQAEMMYAADGDFWRLVKGARDFAGQKISASVRDTHKLPPPSWVDTLKMTGVSGFDPDPSCIRTGNNSGYQALHVAVHAGARSILLFGFDMRGSHWHGRHEPPLIEPTEVSFSGWIREFEILASILRSMKVDVINCSIGSALKCFPVMTMEQAFETSADSLSRRAA